MKPPAFAYERPDSVRAALDALSRHGADAKLLAGGHSLIPMLNLRLLAPGRLIDIGRLSELQYIAEEPAQLRIGPITTQNTILRSPAVAAACPIMVEACRYVANHSIRNHGTLGGSLCHNDPLAEMPLAVTLLGATMVARSRRNTRTIAAAKFFKAPFETDLTAEEMLVEIRIPRQPAGHGYSFQEVSQRLGDRALVAAGCLLTLRYGMCRDVRIGYRGVGDAAFRVPAAEARIEGKPPSTDAIAAAAEAAAAHVTPPADLHADSVYRRELAATLTRRVLQAALASAGHRVDAGAPAMVESQWTRSKSV
jgi:CO/xanthine dehydrogenase FAD-binding subunit